MTVEYDPNVPLADQLKTRRTYEFTPLPDFVLGVVIPPPELATDMIVSPETAQERVRQGQIDQCPIIQVLRAGAAAADAGIEAGKCYTFRPCGTIVQTPEVASLHLYPAAFVGLPEGVFVVHYRLLMLETVVFDDGDIVLPNVPKALVFTEEKESE